MLRLRHHESTKPLLRIRFADEFVGVLVLGCLALFIAAIVEAGVLHQWLTPSARLRFVLPESGIAGLAVGNDVELMGTRVGSIRAVHLNQHSQMYAVAEIDPQFEDFVRQDSVATIRRRFVVAGTSYVDLSRGHGAPLDWKFAELPAKTAPNPADMITKTLSEIEKSVIPVMQNAKAVTDNLKTVTENLKNGRGTVGQLLTDDTLIREADDAATQLDAVIAQLQPMERQISGVIGKADGTMKNLKATSADVRQMTPQAQNMVKNLDTASAELPAVLVQAQTMASSLKKLSDQLRSLWLLGGSGKTDTSKRLPPSAIAP